MPVGLYDKNTGRLVVPEGMAVHLSRIGYDAPPLDYILNDLVPQRKTHVFALHPDNWKGTFWSLTGKDHYKITAYSPKLIPIVPGTLVADMFLANRYQRSGDPAAAQAYADSVRPLEEADLASYRYPELLIPRDHVSLGSSLIDLREHFGIWDRCGNTRFFKKDTEHSKIYLNPLDGKLLVAHATPLASGAVTYELTVRDASKAAVGDIEKSYEENAPFPWIQRAVKQFFYYQAIGWALDAIKEYTGKEPLPGDREMGNFLRLYEPGGKRYREQGGSPESDKPMLEEALEAITRTIAGMRSTIVDYGRNLSEEDLQAAFAEAGILEC